ncbi:helix-turn-helix transcriptional regulator [Cytobacillus depressus]|uniref:Helix-turn-helix transcriptional regulator n=1 Tax=Cytobacillus depressus TaxID=1602942 RepID=A0A6L3V4K1_9BACI|nr:helix-turn-helix transcriptional regulator [Cytobacillus depressus]KAB2328959.1 helix-turn-helix transcriptional regulator [Cytobacillus depressus]
MSIFGERFKALRLEKDLSMQALGDLIGVGKSTIASYESGDKKPKTARLKQIADLFEVSTDYLLGTSDDPLTKETSRNLAILLKESNDFHYNGIPLSEEDLQLFNNILERMLKDVKEKSPNQAQTNEQEQE